MPGGTNMWKRDEAVNPPSGQSGTPGASTQPAGPPTPASRTRSERDGAHIAPAVVIKGKLHSSEDLTIDGVVEGQIELREHVLTIGPHGRIKAQVVVKSVVVLGEVTGDVTASELIDIREGGAVDGNLAAPRVAIAGGAHLGPAVVIKGKLHSSADLTIDGVVEGQIELREHVLTIGPHGRIKAQVVVKSVVVLGEVTGDVTASELIDIREGGAVDGNLAAPRVAIAGGAHLCGRLQKTAAARPAGGKNRTTVSA